MPRRPRVRLSVRTQLKLEDPRLGGGVYSDWRGESFSLVLCRRFLVRSLLLWDGRASQERLAQAIQSSAQPAKILPPSSLANRLHRPWFSSRGARLSWAKRLGLFAERNPGTSQ